MLQFAAGDALTALVDARRYCRGTAGQTAPPVRSGKAPRPAGFCACSSNRVTRSCPSGTLSCRGHENGNEIGRPRPAASKTLRCPMASP